MPIEAAVAIAAVASLPLPSHFIAVRGFLDQEKPPILESV